MKTIAPLSPPKLGGGKNQTSLLTKNEGKKSQVARY